MATSNSLVGQPPRDVPVATSPPVATFNVDPAIARLVSSRMLVVGLLAIVGPLGLPAMWLSPRFSRLTKIVTTALFLVVTVLLPLTLAYYWLEVALRPLVDAFGQVQP